MTKRIVFSLSVLALILSLAWFIAQPGYEPAITFVLGLAGIISSIWIKSGQDAESASLLSEKAKAVLLAAAKTNGNIAVFNMPQKKFVEAGVQSQESKRFEGTLRESAEYVDAVDELTEKGLVKFERESLWRVTSAGYKMADKMK